MQKLLPWSTEILFINSLEKRISNFKAPSPSLFDANILSQKQTHWKQKTDNWKSTLLHWNILNFSNLIIRNTINNCKNFDKQKHLLSFSFIYVINSIMLICTININSIYYFLKFQLDFLTKYLKCFLHICFSSVWKFIQIFW